MRIFLVYPPLEGAGGGIFVLLCLSPSTKPLLPLAPSKGG